MSLKSLRIASGLTQKKAAEVFDIKYRTYQNYENGVTSPDMDTAAMFARYFECTIGDLFDLEEGANDGLSSSERRLLELYRSLSPLWRDALVAAASGMSTECLGSNDG